MCFPLMHVQLCAALEAHAAHPTLETQAQSFLVRLLVLAQIGLGFVSVQASWKLASERPRVEVMSDVIIEVEFI